MVRNDNDPVVIAKIIFKFRESDGVSRVYIAGNTPTNNHRGDDNFLSGKQNIGESCQSACTCTKIRFADALSIFQSDHTNGINACPPIPVSP